MRVEFKTFGPGAVNPIIEGSTILIYSSEFCYVDPHKSMYINSGVELTICDDDFYGLILPDVSNYNLSEECPIINCCTPTLIQISISNNKDYSICLSSETLIAKILLLPKVLIELSEVK